MIHPPIVYIEWHDAAQLSGGWQDREEVLADAERFYAPICAAGFLLQDGPQFLVLSAAYNGHNDDAARSFLIPRSEISKVVQLRPAKGMAA